MITPEKDAEEIKNSIKSRNDNSIIDILSQRNYNQRLMILKKYNKNYKGDLLVELKRLFSQKLNIQEIIISLFEAQDEIDCSTINKAIIGNTLKCDINLLIEIISTRSSSHIKKIIQKYLDNYKGKDLIKEIELCTSGIIQNLLLNSLKVEKSVNNFPDMEECEKSAEILKNEYVINWTKKESFFMKILAEKSSKEMEYISKY